MSANVTLPDLFSDHAVLQRAAKVPVWGTAQPGEEVTVSISKVTQTAKTDAKGHWRVALDLLHEGDGPFELVVAGTNRLTISDVLIGEVWVCSGQSNMEWKFADTLGARENIAASTNSRLRQFDAVKKSGRDPIENLQGKWIMAGPASTGAFTAVGYEFGKKIQHDLGVPVGLLSTAWGGTPVESWISLDALKKEPQLSAGTLKAIAVTENQPKAHAEYLAELTAWKNKYHREGPAAADPALYAGADISTADWTPITLPGSLAQKGLPDAGAIWIRRELTVTESMTFGPMQIHAGIPRDFDTVYFDGVKVAESQPETSGAASQRDYFVRTKAKPGHQAPLAIRIVAPAGGIAVTGPGLGAVTNPAGLTGKWLAKAEYTLPPLSEEARKEYPPTEPRPAGESKTATYLYNGMVYPMASYAFKGVIWYQGEDNTGRAVQYRTSFPLMIKDWRHLWGAQDYPFYFCQLASYGEPKDHPGESNWAELREAQTKTLSLPNTGQAILTDLGESGDIHPRDKSQVGARLALIALANTYGKEVPFSGPVYEKMKVEGNTIRLTFTSVGQGLVARKMPAVYRPSSTNASTLPLVKYAPDSELQGFIICGDDRRWQWAKAKIEGSSVVVSSAQVPNPVAVRFAWADFPIFNLYNTDGLPAGPFRTDDFKENTAAAKYGE